MSAQRAVRVGDHAKHGIRLEGRGGAGDEGPGSDLAGNAEEDYVVSGEIIGTRDRHVRRWRERYEEGGFRTLFDRRRGRPSPKRVPMAVMERVLEM
jgi:hypothetical protein